MIEIKEKDAAKLEELLGNETFGMFGKGMGVSGHRGGGHGGGMHKGGATQQGVSGTAATSSMGL